MKTYAQYIFFKATFSHCITCLHAAIVVYQNELSHIFFYAFELNPLCTSGLFQAFLFIFINYVALLNNLLSYHM